MLVANPGHARVVVSDYTLTTDAGLDESEPHNAPHVLDLWQLGRYALGPLWATTTRAALWQAHDKPTKKQAAQRRADFLCWLVKSKARHVLLLPTADASMGGHQAPLHGTQAWQALGPPDNIEAMRGTRWDRDGIEITVAFPVAKRVKELQRWCTANWLRALEAPTLRPDPEQVAIHPGAKMRMLLAAMRGRPLAVDLEFHPDIDLITAVGLSDGERAVSIPMDPFNAKGSHVREPGLFSYRDGLAIYERLAALLAAPTPKVAHNYVADVPRLTRRGLKVGGPLHDTFAAHAIAYPELRHGLQAACASVLPVPPWKSLYRPSVARGITRDDAEWWTTDGTALRAYNALDSFHTLHLARAVLPHVGVSLAH